MMDKLIFVAFFTLAFMILVMGILGLRERARDKAGERFMIAVMEKVVTLIDQHLATLVRKRRRMIRIDDYGVEDPTEWQKEIQHFLNKVARPTLTSAEASLFTSGVGYRFVRLVDDRVKAGMETIPVPKALPADLSALDFEGLCAEVLREKGWRASTTQASGDQGADVVADKNGLRLVLQCKLYAGTVGNKAVQEVAAAMPHYGATHGVVVATNGFTKSAITLAQSTGVHLLHFDDLGDFAERL